MILILYGVLLTISIILIVLGLAKPSESAQAIIGFFFLFLLAVSMIGGGVEYKTGDNTTIDYTYANGSISSSIEVRADNYKNFSDADSRRFGIYLAIASAIGFAGVMFSIGNTNWKKE